MTEVADTTLWFVYIIEAENGYFYTGITTSVEKRFQEHKNGKTGAKFFKISPPKKIVFYEKAFSKSDALKKEAFIKKMSKKKKLAYIKDHHDFHTFI
jgi:putative endonuclease